MILILPRGSDCQEVVLDHIPPDLFRCLQFRTNPWEEEKRKNYKHTNSSKLIFPREFQESCWHQKPSMLLQRVTNSYSHTFTYRNRLLDNRSCDICVSEALYQKEKNKQHEKQIAVTCRTWSHKLSISEHWIHTVFSLHNWLNTGDSI